MEICYITWTQLHYIKIMLKELHDITIMELSCIILPKYIMLIELCYITLF